MTMHLARGLTTINTKKPKQKKLTESQRQAREIEWRQYNKEMRRKNMHSAQFETLEDYINYLNGVYKPKKVEARFSEYKPAPGFRRETPYVPSFGDGVGNGLMKERQVYTGSLIKGIATMHKSNAVPVLNEEQAKDIAQMRRN
jgi:hypothetical protein